MIVEQRRRRAHRATAWVLASLLVLLQGWLGPAAMLRASAPGLAGETVICHASSDPSEPGQPQPADDGCALCPLCHALAAGLLLPQPLLLPHPALAWAPAPRPAPPGQSAAAARPPAPYDPTGPPVLS